MVDYTDPTMGMDAMRARSHRAELQDGGEPSAHNALIGGEVAVVGSGGDPQPPTAPTGALMSAPFCPDKNTTFSREIRERSRSSFLGAD